MQYVNLVENVLEEQRKIVKNSPIYNSLINVIKIFFLNKLKDGENILVQKNSSLNLEVIKKDLVLSASHMLVGKDVDTRMFGLTRKGYCLATGMIVPMGDSDIADNVWYKHLETVSDTAEKIKKHSVLNKKGHVEKIKPDGKVVALTPRELKYLQHQQDVSKAMVKLEQAWRERRGL